MSIPDTVRLPEACAVHVILKRLSEKGSLFLCVFCIVWESYQVHSFTTFFVSALFPFTMYCTKYTPLLQPLRSMLS